MVAVPLGAVAVVPAGIQFAHEPPFARQSPIVVMVLISTVGPYEVPSTLVRAEVRSPAMPNE